MHGLGVSRRIEQMTGGTFVVQSFEVLAVYSETILNVSVPQSATERVQVTYAGPEFFDMLGVSPALGRALSGRASQHVKPAEPLPNLVPTRET